MDVDTASEQIIAGVRESWEALIRLSPHALVLNVGLSILVAGLAMGLGLLVRRLLRRRAEGMPDPADAEKELRTRKVATFTWSLFETGLFVTALIALARVWGFDVMGWLSAGFGHRVVESIVRIAILALVTFAAAELTALLINRLLARMAMTSGGGGRRTAQLNTVGPLLHGVARGVIVLIGALMIFSEVGVEIGPLLAGAGVVGLAVGFGAQTLVKDFLTGIFLLAEDIVAVGDVVEVGGASGVVEQMTVRTIRLRAADGTLHVLPYSEAQVIHNMTKSFSFHVIELRISYESDIDRAFAVMNQVVEEMRADPAWRTRILAPLEELDVSAMNELGVTLHGRIKTPPGAHWAVGRAFNRRIVGAWRAAGVDIPHSRPAALAATEPPPEMSDKPEKPEGGDA